MLFIGVFKRHIEKNYMTQNVITGNHILKVNFELLNREYERIKN